VKVPEIDTAAAAATLRVLGNETRLQIVLRLLRGETAVSDLERELGIRQPNLSQQLGELRDAGLVVGRREAKSVIYSLSSASQERLVTALSYGFGGPGPLPRHRTAEAAVDTRRGHLGAVFSRVTTDE
jgi:ArsR family transcriptional regulator